MNKPKKAKLAVSFYIILILVLGIVFGGLQILGPTAFSGEEETASAPVSRTVVKNGVSYYPRQDITVVLVLGIDEEGPVVPSGYYRNNGEADAVALLILDESQENYSILCLNRDTMMEMPALGIGGAKAGSYYGQLALSHTFGEGLEDSCENTREAVSSFLNGITIDHYVSVHMDAIAMINDAVGGVTVNVTDDFSAVDTTIPKGVVTLNGRQARSFVQTRQGVGNQLNISRMTRHEAYMKGLMESVSLKLDESDSFALDLYDQVQDYVVTDCSANVISALMNRCSDYSLKEITSPEGENVLGKEFYEFYTDPEKLEDLVLRLFYAEK